MPDLYRVDNHQPRNLYRGDEYIGVMFDPADTAMIAELLNREAGEEDSEPAEFRDLGDDIWLRQPDGRYWCEAGRGSWGEPRKLECIKEWYGIWGEGAPRRFRDGDGHWWDQQPDRRYYVLEAEGRIERTLEWIKEKYGEWTEHAG